MVINQRWKIQQSFSNQRHGYYKNEPKEDLVELAMTAFAAASDGHGGDECSNYLVEALRNQLRVAMREHRVALRERRLSKVERFDTNQTKRKTQPAAELLRKTRRDSRKQTRKLDYTSQLTLLTIRPLATNAS